MNNITLEEIVEDQEQHDKNKHNFYDVKLDKDGRLKSINIDRVKLLELLMDNGFYRYDLTVDRFCFVRVKDKKVQQISLTYITDWFFNYLDELPAYSWTLSKYNADGELDELEVTISNADLKNKFLMSMGSYFSETILSRLTPEQEIKFTGDTRKEKNVFYKNGFVRINKAGCHFNPDYSKLSHHVWENQILARNYNPARSREYQKAEFYQFCYNISGKRADRFKSLQTIIGYVLHSYNNYKMQATILTDAQIGTDGEANGRTGKGVFANGLGLMLNNSENKEAKVYCQVNGKGFDFNDKHKYSKADINTKLIHLEDVKAYFVFDNLFNDITENVTVDIKNEKPFNINPKILISTNKTIKINGASAEDRAIQFEFAEHYTQNYSPVDEFKKWFFTDWTNEEWELFDAFMCQSISEFFANNVEVIDPPKINLTRRSLIEHTSQEFINFMDYYKFTDKDHHEGTTPISYYLIPAGKESHEYVKKELYNEFIESYPDMTKRKRFSQAKFTTWLRAYTAASDVLQSINPELDERRSSNKDYIVFRRGAIASLSGIYST